MADKDSDPRVWVVCGNYENVLVAQRSEACNNPGTWGFPGGHMDNGEEPIDGAVREFYEETGMLINPSKLKFLACGTVKKKDCIWLWYPTYDVGLLARRLKPTTEISSYAEIHVCDLTEGLFFMKYKEEQMHYSAYGLSDHNPRFKPI